MLWIDDSYNDTRWDAIVKLTFVGYHHYEEDHVGQAMQIIMQYIDTASKSA